MTDTLNKIVIVGQGAIGLLWYHHLNQIALSRDKKLNISLLASNQHIHTTQNIDEFDDQRYKFTAYQQHKSQSFPLTYCQNTDIRNAKVLLLCVKSYQVVDALIKIAQYINPNCLIILAHNGMGIAEEVIKLFPKKQALIAMLITHGSLRNKPLSIIHTGLGQSDIGLLSGELSVTQQVQLSSILNQALPNVIFHQDIVKKQWLKLAVNCVINPITTINNIDNGNVNFEEYQVQIDALLKELIKISKAEQVSLVYMELKTLVYNVAQATAKNCSSMRCDVIAGKQTEIDYINGHIHRLGEKHNIATPENTQLWQQVSKLEVKV